LRLNKQIPNAAGSIFAAFALSRKVGPK